ncbi:MAG: hypothetical protein IE925_11385 [Rhodobacterales bacterium]|nr:hypothetical protein [Rhodobacterales bacterium]
MKHSGIAIALAALITANAEASPTSSDYACEVRQKAGIAGIHIEGSGNPKSFVDTELPTRFRLRMTATANDKGYILSEQPYEGPDRDRREYQTENTLLHSTYSGDGTDFRSDEDLGFMRLGKRLDGTLWFYHSGFEYPGGADTDLSARWGLCNQIED